MVQDAGPAVLRQILILERFAEELLKAAEKRRPRISGSVEIGFLLREVLEAMHKHFLPLRDHPTFVLDVF